MLNYNCLKAFKYYQFFFKIIIFHLQIQSESNKFTNTIQFERNQSNIIKFNPYDVKYEVHELI